MIPKNKQPLTRPQQFDQKHVVHRKPVVAQLKKSVSAPKANGPVAPPVYRPQPVPKVLQKKSSPGQLSPADQTPRRPVPPPVYRPEAKKIVQPKTITQQRNTPPAPAAYRPEQKKIALRSKAAPAIPRQGHSIQLMMGPQQKEPNPTDHLAIEHAIHLLQPEVMESAHDALVERAHHLRERFHANGGVLDKYLADEIPKFLDSLRNYIFNQNPILQGPWEAAVSKTRSSLYSDVGSKYGYELRRRLEELAGQDSRWSAELARIVTEYVNKHHVLLKSVYPALQINAANLLHAGIGEQGHTNTNLHKAMHALTAMTETEKPNYSRMQDDVKALLEDFVKSNQARPYEFL